MKLAGSIAIALTIACGVGAHAQERRPDPFAGNLPTFDPNVEVGFAVVNVSDMKKSVAFYETLGFVATIKTVAHSGVPGTPESKDLPMTIFQTAPGVNSSGIHLVQAEGPIVLGNAYNRLGIRVVDAVGVCRSLAAAGTPCLREPRTFHNKNMTIAVGWAKDPDGRLLELVQQTPD
jgi:catechol 2,3-dioxygenase-like lactoylglutathione lyase family enzyme